MAMIEPKQNFRTVVYHIHTITGEVIEQKDLINFTKIKQTRNVKKSKFQTTIEWFYLYEESRQLRIRFPDHEDGNTGDAVHGD